MQSYPVNQLSSSQTTHPRSESSSKIKLNCVLSDSCNEFFMELSDKTSIATLKRRISEKLNLDKANLFNVIFNEKNLTNFNQLKLSDIISPLSSSSRNENFYISNTNSNDLVSDNRSEQSTDLNSFQIKIVPYDTQSNFNKESKVKYMLECYNHFNENAHYYCFDCMKSFCALCVEEHTTHDFLDKYDYSKTNKEIVEGIIKNFVMNLRQKGNGKGICNNKYQNIMINKIIGKEVPDNNKDNNNNEIIRKKINDLGKCYDEYDINYNLNFKKKLNENFEDFRENLKKFKVICMNSLSDANAKLKKKMKNKTDEDKNLNDIIVVDDEYFKHLHSTIKELNIGKEALMKYITVKNEEMNNEIETKENFDKEIEKDIDNLIKKIKAKYTNIKFEDDNIFEIIQTESNNTIYENENLSNQSTMKLEDLHENNKNNNNSTELYLMKRKLNTDIVMYNLSTKKFEVKKEIKKENTKIKRFLNFSVYINYENNLYISGGKTKEEKCKNDFFKYNPLSNTLILLSPMINPRCSHSMIGINNEIYVIGGYNTNTCEKYSLSTNEWKSLPKLNSRERQVSTLFNINDTYLYSIFGFIRGENDNDNYGERLNIKNANSKWVKIVIKHSNIPKNEIKRFNVGLIKIKEGEFLVCGGENLKNEESDKIFRMHIKNDVIELEENKGEKLPIKCSFIDKEFYEIKNEKYGQFEMKKNNFVIYNLKKNKFKVKNFLL